ncbi:permease prefix domain 1-containing protein [Gordonia McavH-238-E]|uniref:permease prefix domain 1-containing protein n=1 Tax=Gordonia sp. McavH-238-E TaxID=2917736 RepID=UPI001EF43F00|nr:permease prefix domain 1-containing protein [Gordonia sp. McavH-238-E]MCG7630934.1 permease prefix domain 1-containing protein [Gordonia sp. McavH-238-E]
MNAGTELENQIDRWRGYVLRHQAIATTDADEMEDHLRGQIADLAAGGLDDDEAFLVAVKRMGRVDALSREFAREHSDRLWKQLVLTAEPADGLGRRRHELGVVIGLVVAAAATVRIALEVMPEWVLVRNATILVLPFLAVYFGWKRGITPRIAVAVATAFVGTAVIVNIYPFVADGPTQAIVAIHAPIVLWFLVGVTYVGGRWRSGPRRMDFIRFTGEWVVYATLLGLGAAVLTGLTAGAFSALDINVDTVISQWLAPIAATGIVLLAAWLVEAKQSVVENIAPVLTKVFTPVTAVMLVVLLVAMVTSGDVVDVDRELLILIDLILVVVLGLLLYAISARDPHLRPELFDRLQLVLVVTALAVDAVMLTIMASRIAEFGFTANKTVALGLNLVLLVNLSWAAYLLFGFVRRRRGFDATERWQTDYLPVFGLWAAAVVVAVPPLFDFA